MKYIPRIFFFAIKCFFAGLVISSCSSSKNLNYFSVNERDSSSYRSFDAYETPIHPGDRLSITVTALNPSSALPYNLPTGGVTVDPSGQILYPQLGFITVAGLNKFNLRDTLLDRLQPYLADAVVHVEFLNFKITVLGEVARQGVIAVPDAKINIIEAIAQAGDITVYGEKSNVLVIRETGKKREFARLNLLSNNIFVSPFYRLQQNDIVYVEAIPKKPTADQQRAQRTITIAASVVAVLSTLSVIVINLTR